LASFDTKCLHGGLYAPHFSFEHRSRAPPLGRDAALILVDCCGFNIGVLQTIATKVPSVAYQK